MMENLIAQSLLSIILLRGFVLGSVDYCKYHLYDNVLNKNVMHFSKENSDREYAMFDGFKSLHCCSHGYRSIEWFKDGVPYPWSTHVSTLIISPESGNQTIYSPVISETDSGQYWCIVRNDTDSLRHDVYLTVFEWSHATDSPKATYKPKDQLVAVGQDARFYCEGFIGNISTPDTKNYIIWRKLDGNNSILNNERIKQEIVFREENQVLGCYLFVKDVRIEDYGVYGCRIGNTGDVLLYLNVSLITEDRIVNTSHDKSYSLERTILFIVLLILSATVSTLFLVFCRSHFRIIYQQFFQRSCSKRGKPYDILVVYHEEERDIALSKIVFTLQSSYHYTCNVQPVTFMKLGCKDLRERAHNSRRVIILLTPSLAERDWSCQKLTAILQEIIAIHPRVITVIFSQLPLNEPWEQSLPLRNLLQRVYCVEYCEAKLQKFWDLLTLGLPARNTNSETGENVELV